MVTVPYLKAGLHMIFNEREVTMSKVESRSKRFVRAQGDAEQAHSEIEALRDELQDWYDNMPENLQDSDKANALQETIDELESLLDHLDEVSNASIDFPTMFS